MADIIDLALVADSKKFLEKLLETRGINYFLSPDARRPFQLEQKRVELVVRTAAKSRPNRKAHAGAFEYARSEIRKLLIRRVVAEMIQVGL